MFISQHDIAQLTDTDIKRLVIQAAEQDHPFFRAVAAALVRARRERVRILAVLELDALNDEIEEGEILP